MPSFLLEVGTEELPANFVDEAIAQWQSRIPSSLEEQQLTPEGIEFYGTPRRLAVLIKGLPAKQSDRIEEVKGPAANVAFKSGKPTKALEGFVRKQGVTPDEVEIRDTDKGEFVFVQKNITGRNTTEILQELVPQWITQLEGRRFMRWGDGDLRFPRPIRWLVTLWDQDILPLELVNGATQVKSDRLTYGHRILAPESVSIPEASAYQKSLQQAYVEVSPLQRRQTIEQQIEKVAKQLKGVAVIPPDLLDEVVNLVEYPSAVAGNFEPDFLNLPTEVITTVMVTHQRYFPVKATGKTNKNNTLLPYFITISNGDPNKGEIIAAGNERVIRARLADAQFFYKADCDEPLESYLPQLETVTFQEQLGTIRDKVDRIMEISQLIADQLDLDSGERSEIESTAMLCKADLVTQMVYEFPELQGVMGQKYALASGESPNVALGIFEHYLPRGADDIMPESLTGQVVGLADRIDTIVSIFGLGMIPTGSGDPFALRRAATGIIKVTWYAELPIDILDLLEQSSQDFVTAHPDKTSPIESLKSFFIQRLSTLLQDDLHIDYDLVNAVLGENDPEYTERALRDLLDVRDRAQFLQSIRNNQKIDEIYETVNRSARLAVKGELDTQELDPEKVIRPALFEKSSEEHFYKVLIDLVPTTLTAQRERNYQLLVDALGKIAPTVSNFFDGEDSVLVMDENLEVRENRLNLLGLLRNHARVLADFGAIVKS
ncbi:glycyl-tRNA synthetase, beta subunit [Gloeothece citriformis PCC 7424]|uniref:Glycine--tRNA ligase beta subunit n=1 Tax=Gloeothece citriformis (strain PCC 7424) TaxID=65393 RepID=SYGB_GLOC7|nr:glycine--tRNA ligase subunit beta [Gloeothece citriformis]B7KD52.1 RecName: Full=Glycine--tRNA ligase beta subunit; AltName: Full=Glycyl-tRNA synthetase beta subunit; Short=GlyRS [Gloeothece citriformis PCC 7424]ACK73173.1 glycyl-tRNA synthetase, beta subunit [Gloeothece citriformis PCC 7424]